jgi:hypothetical protein
MAEDEKHEKKKVTAATTDAPQEEFISPVNQPSVPEPKPPQKDEQKSDSASH